MPLVDLANPGQGSLVKTIAGPFSSFLPDFGTRHDTGKYFKEHSYPNIIQKGGDGVTNLDDPTYLGFNLMFLSSSPLFNKGEGNADQSALGYLTNVDPTRASYLKAFISGIQRINIERPWYWQTVTGLDELWNKNIVNPKDPYVGTTSGEGVSIGCLEAVDLKLTALFSLYRIACYDTKYRRFVVPKNLRYFDIDITVLEIRNFKQTRGAFVAAATKAKNLMGMSPGESAQNTLAYLNSNTSSIKFSLTNCEWDPKSGGKVFDSVTNVGGEYASTSIKFSYGDIMETGNFSGLDHSLKGDFYPIQDGPRKGLDAVAGKAAQIAKDKVANLANEGLNKLEDAALAQVSKLNPSGLGNVFGAGASSQQVNNPLDLLGTLNGAGVQVAQVLGASSPITLDEIGGNIMPTNVPVVGDPGGGLESNNIFGGQERLQQNSLPTERVFGEGIQPGSLSGDENALGEPNPGPGPLESKNLFDG